MIPTLGIYGIQDQGTYPAPRWTHDHCVALFVDGRLEWALELERYTRRKHDNRLHLFLEQLVEEGVLPLPEHFRIVAVDSLAGRAFLTSSGKWRIEGNSIPLPEGYSHWTWWINRSTLFKLTSGWFFVMRQFRQAFFSLSEAPSEFFC